MLGLHFYLFVLIIHLQSIYRFLHVKRQAASIERPVFFHYYDSK